MISGDFHLFFVFLLFNIVERQYKRNGKDMDENNVPDMRPTFEEIRKVDDNGKEYWSSRELCNSMGYSGYWKFQNVIDKAIKVASEKGMDIDDHFNHVVEMVKLGSGSFRKVEAFHLSRMACMMISIEGLPCILDFHDTSKIYHLNSPLFYAKYTTSLSSKLVSSMAALASSS